MGNEHTIEDLQLAESLGYLLRKLGWATAHHAYAIGAFIGAFIFAELHGPNSHAYEPVVASIVFGALLALVCSPMAVIGVLIERRGQRFDQRVQVTLARVKACRRAGLSTGVLLSLSAVVIMLGPSSQTTMHQPVHAALRTALFLSAVAIVIWSRNTPEFRIDWTRLKICRNCGLTSPDEAPTCANCGEEAIHA